MFVVRVAAKHEENSWLWFGSTSWQDATAATTESYQILARNILKRG